MPFTAQDVKTLREMTECGMLDCKKALMETDGDMEKAVEFLREKGLASVAKKSGRIAAEGIVLAFTDEAKKLPLQSKLTPKPTSFPKTKISVAS